MYEILKEPVNLKIGKEPRENILVSAIRLYLGVRYFYFPRDETYKHSLKIIAEKAKSLFKMSKSNRHTIIVSI